MWTKWNYIQLHRPPIIPAPNVFVHNADPTNDS
ncbi:hypothetical protein EYZ11_006493 [Aspergillus tanneri]|uniref:Uncharacterized protein n=1 Tax=Aspergillus tanneri TaxID=1220188 RepID=A0A4S3JL48_9EURO|nr:hypothetical protein EYZ11_006493 [Aspergillus tanneri]